MLEIKKYFLEVKRYDLGPQDSKLYAYSGETD